MMERFEHLSPAEQLDLIAYLAQKARGNYGGQRPRQQEPTGVSLADSLYGALGRGTLDEYNSVNEWERFA